MKHEIGPIAAAALLAAGLVVSAVAFAPRYDAYVSGGTIYRLNLRTGALQACDQRSCIPVTIPVKE